MGRNCKSHDDENYPRNYDKSWSWWSLWWLCGLGHHRMGLSRGPFTTRVFIMEPGLIYSVYVLYAATYILCLNPLVHTRSDILCVLYTIYFILCVLYLYYTRSLGALRTPTSSLWPFGPAWLRPSRPSGAQAVWPTRRCNDWITHYPSVRTLSNG